MNKEKTVGLKAEYAMLRPEGLLMGSQFCDAWLDEFGNCVNCRGLQKCQEFSNKVRQHDKLKDESKKIECGSDPVVAEKKPYVFMWFRKFRRRNNDDFQGFGLE